MRVVFILLCFFSIQICNGQFTFGTQAGLTLSQIEGDNLRGFKKAGYEFGLLGGYRLSNSNSISIALSYGLIGSKKANTPVPTTNTKYLSELSLNTLSVFCGYVFEIGDNWEGTSDFRFTSGLKYSKIISTNAVHFGKDGLFSSSDILNNDMLLLKFGPGVFISDKVLLEIFYEHSLINVAKQIDSPYINKAVPFYLSFALSYII